MMKTEDWQNIMVAHQEQELNTVQVSGGGGGGGGKRTNFWEPVVVVVWLYLTYLGITGGG